MKKFFLFLTLFLWCSHADAANRYWVGGALNANWTEATAGVTNWGSASNTRDLATVPGATDDVFFDGVGFGASNSTIDANISIKSLDCTGYTNTLTHNSAVTLTIAGNLFKLVSGMTYTVVSTTNSALSFTSTTGTVGSPTAITTAGKTVGVTTINGAAGYFTLQDNLTVASGITLTFTAGTLDANGNNVTAGQFSSNNSNTRAIVFGNGTWTFSGSNGTVWACAVITNMTITRGNAIQFTYAGATATRFLNHGNSGGITEANSVDMAITAGTDIIDLKGACHNLTYAGFTGSVNNNPFQVFGNFTAGTGMTMTAGTSNFDFKATSGTQLVTTNNVLLDFPVRLTVTAAGTVQLQDAMTVGSTRLVTVSAGTLDANNNNFTMGRFTQSGGTILMGTGTWELKDTTTSSIWSNTGGTVTPSSSTIKISGSTTNVRTFAGGTSKTYANLWFTNATTAGALTITATTALAFADFRIDAADATAQTITFPNVTTTVTTFSASGSVGKLVTLQRTGAAGTFTLSQASGTVCRDYLSISNSTVTGGASWYAGANTTDGGGNTGWTFTACPASSANGNYLMCMS